MIIHGLIYTEKFTFEEGILKTHNDRISDVDTLEWKKDLEDIDIDEKDCYVIPALIDIHLHGALGCDFCDAKKESIDAILEYELQNGVAKVCLTSMSFDEERLTQIFSVAGSYIEGALNNSKDGKRADIVGINMEGPFISIEKRAAQNEAYIQAPDIEMFKRLNKSSGNQIRIVDIAPEEAGAIDFIKEVTKDGSIKVSLAHTMASYDTAMEAFEAGADHVTHFYNAMTPFNHRETGVIGASVDRPDVYIELIGDSVHCSDSAIRMAYKLKGDDRIVLISDSMSAAGMPDGEYSLGGQTVIVRNKVAHLSDGRTLAGSASSLMDNVRNMVFNAGIPIDQVIRCATANPAKAIGIFEENGSLSVGKAADILVLDKDLQIKHIIKDGRKIY